MTKHRGRTAYYGDFMQEACLFLAPSLFGDSLPKAKPDNPAMGFVQGSHARLILNTHGLGHKTSGRLASS